MAQNPAQIRLELLQKADRRSRWLGIGYPRKPVGDWRPSPPKSSPPCTHFSVRRPGSHDLSACSPQFKLFRAGAKHGLLHHAVIAREDREFLALNRHYPITLQQPGALRAVLGVDQDDTLREAFRASSVSSQPQRYLQAKLR